MVLLHLHVFLYLKWHNEFLASYLSMLHYFILFYLSFLSHLEV